MPDEWDTVRWHGSWSPEHPVRESRGTLPLYVSVEDAVHRIRTSFAPTDKRPTSERIWAALNSGRSVAGYEWLKEDPRNVLTDRVARD